MLKIGIVGCGFIGGQICRAIDNGEVNAELYALCDSSESKVFDLSASLKTCSPLYMNIEEIIRSVDLVIESASQNAVRFIVPQALKAGCDVMVLSVGALADEELRTALFGLAKQHNCKLYFPSGAVVGIDGLNSASAAGISSVTLTTRKPPSGLMGAPYVVEHGIELDKLVKETVLFEGTASEAVKAFPANVNVAATISLAGIGFEQTRVRVIADPSLSRNVHEITVEGEFGKFSTRVENLPSPENPKTSYLAALSAVSTLKKILNPVQVGT
ncbi:MAG: aspartate dehydrogenase [Methanosarcina sp.]|uniref:aspartate dehydrogenase n=1 Tax=Methanosarcina sp. TaxID=2213 RepID=UPI00263117DE|nr:aspartate dehydrogenase [Methanosarcina sp.]MDD3248569.1 aspartate dehydrogenase [Methanosarcina sp.]MDD4249091.1 aspartate dehydrogenase [Methanosarcina sp.]